MGEHKQFKRILECINGNFLTQVVEEQKRGHAVLDLYLQTRKN